MLFFKPTTDITTFRLSVSSTGLDSTVAYGPGSVINGSIFLETEQPIEVNEIFVLFQCEAIQEHRQEHQQHSTRLFRIKEPVQLSSNSDTHDNATKVVSAGSHMNLFAIQFPLVNFPPTITETNFTHQQQHPKQEYGCHINYTIQAFLERPGEKTLTSSRIPVMYLPLVTKADSVTNSTLRATSIFTMKDASIIEMKAQLMRSICYPGDECCIQLMTNNKTNLKVNQVYVTFITRIATDNSPNSQQQEVIYHQAIPVSIPKQTSNHIFLLSFPVPQYCLPSFDYCRHGFILHIQHEVVIGLTSSHYLQYPSDNRLQLSQSTQTAINAPLAMVPTTVTSLSSPSAVSPSTTSVTPPTRFFAFSSFYGPSSASLLASSTISPPMRLPITITTIPPQHTAKHKIHVIYENEGELLSTTDMSALPSFITTSSSPTAATDQHGVHVRRNKSNEDDEDNSDDCRYSVSPSGSFILNDSALVADRHSTEYTSTGDNGSHQHQQQQHLAIPSRATLSTSSSSSSHS